jgi:NAD(P)H dehydrogenase (quinone)
MIMITGGSGQLSTLVARGLSARKLPFVIGSHKTASGDRNSRRIDFDDPQSLDFSGISTLLLVSAGYAEDDVVLARHDAVIEAAEKQGVGAIVYTSLTGTGDHLGFALAHRWTERRLRESSLSWTILRNGLYAELIGWLATPVDGAIRSPFGNASISSVAREDLADAAVAVLADPKSHARTVYELAGPEAWRMTDFAQALGVEYRPETLSQARQRLLSLPLLPFQAPMLMSIYSAAATGFLDTGATDLVSLLDHSPRSTLPLAVAAASAPTG